MYIIYVKYTPGAFALACYRVYGRIDLGKSGYMRAVMHDLINNLNFMPVRRIPGDMLSVTL